MPIIIESPSESRCKTCRDDLSPLEITECRPCVVESLRSEQSRLLAEWRAELTAKEDLRYSPVKTPRRGHPLMVREVYTRLKPTCPPRELPRVGLCIQIILGIRDRRYGVGYRMMCGICHELFLGPMEIDHIIPLSVGGPHHIHNLQYAHPKCNREKGGRM